MPVNLTTVRDMIEDAIVTDNCDPVVDFKLIESVLFIMAYKLNLLHRHVATRINEIMEAKIRLKRKADKAKKITTLTVSQIKIHGKSGRKGAKGAGKGVDTTTTAESTTEKTSSAAKKHHRSERTRSSTRTASRHGSRSKSRSKSRARSRSESGSETETGAGSRTKSRHHKRSGPRAAPAGKSKSHKKDRKTGKDVVHEKLLVLSRTTSMTLDIKERDYSNTVATQKQYYNLLAKVRQLQAKFGVTRANAGTSWGDLHGPTSFTNPRAALNLATRLEVTHRKLNDMLGVVTDMASDIPGIKLEGNFDTFNQNATGMTTKSGTTTTGTETAMSSQTMLQPSSTSVHSTLTTDGEKVKDEVEDFFEDIAEWTELDDQMNSIREDVLTDLSTKAGTANENAQKAIKLFKQNAPQLQEASMLSIKCAKLTVSVDRFANRAIALDSNLARQMGDAQEQVSQMQYTVELIKEKIDEFLTHPAEDPAAVAVIGNEFTNMQCDLSVTKANQTSLKELQEQSAAEFERVWKKIKNIQHEKTSRDEALKSLENKATVVDINGILERDQLYATVGYMEQEINAARKQINSGEMSWQTHIEDFLVGLHDRCDRVQAITLHQSLRENIGALNGTLSAMINIFGDFPINVYEKALYREGNCLCCRTPAEVKLSAKKMELARRCISQQLAKSKQEQEMYQPIESPSGPCVPGRPIPHSIDPRALICPRVCGATVSKSDESLPSALKIGVKDINRIRKEKPKQVHYTCPPCTQLSEETLLK